MTEPTPLRRVDAAGRTGSGQGRSFAIVAHGENVVMIDTQNGRSWALASDDGVPVWQPIVFQGNAPRAPRGVGDEPQ